MNETKNENRFELIEARNLRIHPVAQRELNPTHMRRIMKMMDLDAIGTVHAVEYPINGDTGPWVIDGQHRIIALIELGFGEWPVSVEIHTKIKDDKAASARFLALNSRATVHSWDRFNNELTAHVPAAVAIAGIARTYGLAIGKQKGDYSLACPDSLRRAYALDFGQSLRKTFGITTSAWGFREASHEGRIIEGVARVVAANNGSLDEQVLTTKLARFPGGPSGVIGAARSLTTLRRSSVIRCISEVIVETYNKGRKNTIKI